MLSVLACKKISSLKFLKAENREVGIDAMPTLSTSIFSRVNRTRPCRICGKPDWCSFTRDEHLSICMRISEGARRINRQGGAIFIHDEAAKDNLEILEVSQSLIATIDHRDFVYRRLIQLSPAVHYRASLIVGEHGLLARGLDEHEFGDYGGLPAGWWERNQFTRQLLLDAGSRFRCTEALRGIPGFWEDHSGSHLWKERDYRAPSLLIPVCDEQGRIQACQMRLPFTSKTGLRYLWLSSSTLPLGCGPGSPLHFKFRLVDLPPDAQIVIVEGALKADVLFTLRSDLFIVATPSVTANHDALIRLTHGREALIAFDQDYCSNKAVCFHLASLIARRMRSEGTSETTRIALWDRRFKGVDDAVVHNVPISSISIRSWLERLSPHFRQIVMTRLTELGAFPFQKKT